VCTHDSQLTQNNLDQKILDYLTDHGRSTCLAISADLDISPYEALKVLHRLREQGKINYIKHPTRADLVFRHPT